MITHPKPSAGLIAGLCLLVAGMVSAQEVQLKPIRFTHESYETIQLRTLRQEYDFDEAVARGNGEYDQMIRLKDWVFTNLTFKHNNKVAQLRNALDILRLGEAGSTFICSQFAAVFMQSALSMGWTARYTFLRNVVAEEHAVNEIWSNELGKWIFIDVTWNIHIEHEGVPLSLLEIRGEWIRNGGKDLVYVFGSRENEARYTYRDFPIERSDNNAWIWWPLDEIFITYTYEIALIGRNNFFSHADSSGSSIYDRIFIIKDDINRWDKRWAFRNRTDVDDVRAFYHDINRVDIAHERNGDGSVSITLDAFGQYNYTPNFKEFLVRTNGGAWKSSDSAFRWPPTRKSNVLEARIRNKFGVLGPVSRATIPEP